jgi:hypothetical protein
MPKQNAIFERVARVSQAGEPRGAVEVELQGGPTLRLERNDERSVGYARILEELHRLGRPVYVEIDAENRIDRLLVPLIVQVGEVRQAGDAAKRSDDLEVELHISHARHLLRRDSPDFEEIRAALLRAREAGTTVAVAVDDQQQILAVRPHEGSAVGSPPTGGPSRETASRRGCFGRWFRSRCMSRRRAQDIFDMVASRTCAPLTVPPPCIPFLYPDDGCWGRAHEMCRLMIAEGVAPKKVWIYGSLDTATKNNPNCHVKWGWHVAPTVCVRSGCLFGRAEMVIDPSLFTTPVTKSTWKGAQGDVNAALQDSDWTIFWRSKGGGSTTTDPTFVQTDQVLSTYRLQLQARSLNVGPPPYAHC